MSHQPEKMGSGNRNRRQGAPELSFSRIGEALIAVIGAPEERGKPEGDVPQGQSAGGVGLFREGGGNTGRSEEVEPFG
jgi:hypothetical protein